VSPGANRGYAITLDDGSRVEGVSDAEGRTALTTEQIARMVDVEIDSEPEGR
jgi:uncharacterized protein (DUF2345 family)